MANKMQWKRSETGGLKLYIEEEGSWKHYTNSNICRPDSTLPGASKGFPTFQYGLKCGYEVLDVNGNSISNSNSKLSEAA